MPLIDVKCTNADCREVSEVNRPLEMWPATPPCPKCGALTERQWVLTRRPDVPAVVAYRMPDGSYRFPGAPDSLATKQYTAQGGARIELRGWAEIRKFEASINSIQKAEISRRIERQLGNQEEGVRRRRAELYYKMKSMSDSAKSFARAAIAHSDSKPTLKPYDPGFRVEVYSENRSNREESRDPQGRRTRD